MMKIGIVLARGSKCHHRAILANSRGTSIEIWQRMVYTVRVAFEVVFLFCIGVCYPK